MASVVIRNNYLELTITEGKDIVIYDFSIDASGLGSSIYYIKPSTARRFFDRHEDKMFKRSVLGYGI